MPVEISGVSKEVADAIADLVDSHGSLQRDHVLEAATDPKSVLHPMFEWDDTAAALAYRKNQASALIRRVNITFTPHEESEPITVRVYASKHDMGNGSSEDVGEYRTLRAIREDPDDQEALKDSIERAYRKLRQRYAHVQKFFDEVVAGIED